MSLNDTQSGVEPIPQETLEKLNKDQLIKVIRMLESFHKGRKLLGHFVCAVVACTFLPFLVMGLGMFGFLLAPWTGIFALYVIDQTSVYFLQRKKTDEPDRKEVPKD